jgi:hypothetical protein
LLWLAVEGDVAAGSCYWRLLGVAAGCWWLQVVALAIGCYWMYLVASADCCRWLLASACCCCLPLLQPADAALSTSFPTAATSSSYFFSFFIFTYLFCNSHYYISIAMHNVMFVFPSNTKFSLPYTQTLH